MKDWVKLFQEALNEEFRVAERKGMKYLIVKAGDLHRKVGGYPGPNHRMPICCHVMRKNMQLDDEVLSEPPSGVGASLTIRYCIPRNQSLRALLKDSIVDEINSMQSYEQLSSAKFEETARRFMSKYFGVPLSQCKILNIPKLFDMVSDDGAIVGDAKYFTMVRGVSIPPAKFSVIAEHVWLLEKTPAKRKFLVFGNDRRVPLEWLKRYGHLVKDVTFYFLDMQSKKLEKLN